MKCAPVTVIVPAYGHADYILALLESALAQDPPPAEVIVVDDGSPDNTATVLQPLIQSRRIRYVRQTNGGMASARNAGAQMATTEFLYFLDDDDFLFPGALAALLQTLRRHPTASMAYGDAVLFRGEPPSPSIPENPVVQAVDRVPFMLFNQLGTPGQVMIRRTAFEAVGGFDASVWGTDDWDLWMRLVADAPAQYVVRPVLAYRMHPDNASRNVARMYNSSQRVARRHLKAFPHSERAILRRYSSLRLREYHVPRLQVMFANAVRARRWSVSGAAARAWVLAWGNEALAYALLKWHLLRRRRWSLPPDAPLNDVIMHHCGRL